MPVLAALVTALVLPGAFFGSVEPAGGKLLVRGSTGRVCVWLTVDPASLEAEQARGSCARPRGSSRPAVAVVIPEPRSAWQPIRIARVGASVGYGRVVMRYRDGSDTRPVSTYGPGALWLYDVETDRGPELLRFSSRTGRLEQTAAMPRLYRPLLAADEDGLYLIAAVNGEGGPGPAALYHVAPGARRATIVHRQGRAALWLTAHAHTVWTEVVGGTGEASIWRFVEARARRLWRGKLGAAPVATYGDGRLWAVTPVWAGPRSGQCASVKVSELDATTGRATTIATVPTSGYCGLLFDPQGLAFFEGALYFLDGSRLYRVRP
jgi:hypothetical protein